MTTATRYTAGILAALAIDPDDDTAWLALADSLEEDGEEWDGLLVRQSHLLRRGWTVDGEFTVQDLIGRRHDTLMCINPLMPSITNSLGVRLNVLPGGEFLMGEGKERRSVKVKAFACGVYPVTQEQWLDLMGVNPSYFHSDETRDNSSFPVEQVSWSDCQEFVKKLNEREQAKDRWIYSLPSSLEWEYACRSGTRSTFHYGDTLTSHMANFNGNHPHGGAEKGPYLQRTCKVGSYRPNAFGLYDMQGNVWEWCQDAYREASEERPSSGEGAGGGQAPNASHATGSTISLADTTTTPASASSQGDSEGSRSFSGEVAGDAKAGSAVPVLSASILTLAGATSTASASSPEDPDAARVLRGGSWFSRGWGCRSAFRNSVGPDYRGGYVGFRLIARRV